MSVITRRGAVAALLAAALALPAATLGAAPANADSKGGPGTHDAICDAWFNVFEQDVDDAQRADDRGDAQARDDALDEAEKDLAQAQAGRCEWAFRVKPPSRIYVPPTGAYAGP
jgi:hypothetical protein